MIKAAIFKIGKNFILHKANEIEKEAVRGGWKPMNTFFVLILVREIFFRGKCQKCVLVKYSKKFSVRVFTPDHMYMRFVLFCFNFFVLKSRRF